MTRLLPILLVLALWTPAAGEPLKLDLFGALTMAMENSPILKEYRSRVREAGYAVDEAFVPAFPTVGFTGTYTRIHPEVSFPGSGGRVTISPADNYNLGLTLRQTIYSFGRLRWGTEAAELNRKAVEQDYRRELERLMLDASLAYGQVLLAERGVDIATENLKARELQLRDAEVLFEAGKVARFDVLQGQADLSAARQASLVATNELNLARARLLSLLGEPTDRPLELTPFDMTRAPEADLLQGRQRALEQRPELVALNFAVDAAQARANYQAAQDNPNLSLQSVAAKRNVTGFAAGETVTTALTLEIPLFDGGLSAAREAQALEVMQQLTQSREQTRRTVLLEVEQAYLDLRSACDQMAVARQTVEQASEANRVANVRYKAGVSTSLELQNSIAALSQARLGLARAEFDHWSAVCRWYRAVSGEYPVPIPASVKLEPDIEIVPEEKP
ncbi:MAG: TolC family protein [Candidatus Eremiobacterota bacterium]